MKPKLDFSTWIQKARQDGIQQLLAGTIISEKGKILVLKRKMNDTLPGYWEIPGGKVEPDETLEQAAIRECKEETGLQVEEIVAVSNIFDYYLGSQKRRQFNFWVECRHGPIKLSEHDEYRWIEPGELASLDPITDSMKESIALAFKNLARNV